jgi:hypothetical protein
MMALLDRERLHASPPRRFPQEVQQKTRAALAGAGIVVAVEEGALLGDHEARSGARGLNASRSGGTISRYRPFDQCSWPSGARMQISQTPPGWKSTVAWGIV